ncbi:MAG TPA: hypothetical protein VKE22_10190 [Haliangiales bacterium]|nr:hypothetical protein [Haliangiales bacterium]
MRIAVVALACAGCHLNLGGPSADAGPSADVANAKPCLEDADRTHACTVPITARIVDFVTRQSVTGRPRIDVTTAWDTYPGAFPDGCASLSSQTLPAGGTFDDPSASCRSRLFPPYLLLIVEGGSPDPRARTAWDRHLACVVDRCTAVVADVWVPSAADVAAWRAELAAGGMPRAGVRGLVLFQFNERGGGTAAGVVPAHYGLVYRPGTEVRFLDADRRTLLPAGTTATGPSGLAVVGVDVGDYEAGAIGGTRGSDVWRDTGVFFVDGWIFVEDQDPG